MLLKTQTSILPPLFLAPVKHDAWDVGGERGLEIRVFLGNAEIALLRLDRVCASVQPLRHLGPLGCGFPGLMADASP